MRDCYGQQVLSQHMSKTISCSGTSMATWDAALTYVHLVASELLSRRKCERNGVDQGVHNYLVHSDVLGQALRAKDAGSVHTISNEEGWIIASSMMPDIRRDRAGRMVNNKGEVVAVVHQYDRHSTMVNQLWGQYPWFSNNALSVKG